MGMARVGMSIFENYFVAKDVKNLLVQLPDTFFMQLRKKSNNKYLNSFHFITDDTEDSDSAVPTSDGTRPRWGYLRS